MSYLGLVVIIQRNGVWGGTGGLSGIFPVGAQGRAKPPIVRVSNRGSEQAILCPAPHSLPHLPTPSPISFLAQMAGYREGQLEGPLVTVGRGQEWA